MGPFKIQPHNRLQEWVAEEKGYFRDEGLDYIFHIPGEPPRRDGRRPHLPRPVANGSVQSTEEAPSDVKRGAFETMEAGRTCDISAACHWAVNMAASGQHGKMWGHAYSVTPSGIYVAAESPIRKPEDLVGRAVGVGYHSGSHFSALQALEAFLEPDQIAAEVHRLAQRPRGAAARSPRRGGQRLRPAVVHRRAAGLSQSRRHVVHDRLSDLGRGRRHGGRREILPRPAARPARHRRRAPAVHPLLPARDGRRVQAAGRRARLRPWRTPGLRAVHPRGLRADPPLDEEARAVPRRPGSPKPTTRTAVLV